MLRQSASMVRLAVATLLLAIGGNARSDVVLPWGQAWDTHTDFATRLRFRSPDPVNGDYDPNRLIADFAGMRSILGVNMDAVALQNDGPLQIFWFRTTAETYLEPSMVWASFDLDRFAGGWQGSLGRGELIPRSLGIGETRLATGAGVPGGVGLPSPGIPTPTISGSGSLTNPPWTIVETSKTTGGQDPHTIVDSVKVAPEPSAFVLFLVGLMSLAFGVRARGRLIRRGGIGPEIGTRSLAPVSDRHALVCG